MCNSLPPPHQMLGHPQLQQQIQNSLGKPPNEADEDAYLAENQDEKDLSNEIKKNELMENEIIINKYGCVQCGNHSILNNNNSSNLTHSPPIITTASTDPSQVWCGCMQNNLLIGQNNKDKIDTQLTRAILEQQFNGSESLAGDSLNSTVGLRDVIDCVTPATTATTTCGRTSSSGNTTTNEEEDENSNKSTNESINHLDHHHHTNDLKEELHLSNLLSTSFITKPSSTLVNDLGSEEDSNEDTSDEHIGILSRKTRNAKEQIKKWRTSSNSIETNTNSTTSTTNLNSPAKNSKSNVPLLIESQTEQFQIA